VNFDKFLLFSNLFLPKVNPRNLGFKPGKKIQKKTKTYSLEVINMVPENKPSQKERLIFQP